MTDMKNTLVDENRRKLLVTGAKYAALVPASTLLVTKSARAGGSTYAFADGSVATSAADCLSIVQGNSALLGEVGACFGNFV